MTRVAIVTAVDYEKGKIKVTLTERNSPETNWITVPSKEYDLPDVNDLVEVTFEEEDFRSGLSHGEYFNERNPPKLHGKDIYYKTMKKDLTVKYDRSSKTLTITAKKLEIIAEEITVTGDIEIAGDMSIIGDVSIDGDLTVSKKITAERIVAGTIIEGGDTG